MGRYDNARYQCERCGGMGKCQPGSYWNPIGNKYEYQSAEHRCPLCNGTGLLGPLMVIDRLHHFRYLKPGWLDGDDGQALDPHGLDRLIGLFKEHYPPRAPIPYAFPTPDDNVMLEWKLQGRPEVEIDLAAMKGEYMVYSDTARSYTLIELDLSGPEGWLELVNLVKSCEGEK